MEQARLREYESKCVQEEPPFCQAVCPLHVDARAVCTEIKRGRIDEALKTLLRVLPLPRLMTQLCEEPCKAACKRKDLGGSLEMRAIERYCVEFGTQPKLPFLPSGGKTIAVVGSALSSLVAAWDLARKGHLITVFHFASIGAEMAQLLPDDLDIEIEALKKLKVSFFSPFDPEEYFIDGLKEKFDRVYVGLDDPSVAGIGNNDKSVFFGGQADAYIERAFQGRRAALSIIRDLQGASLSAGREREGAFETRLYTNTSGIEAVPPSADPVSEAERCLDCQCLECVKACKYLQFYKGYPKRYAREIYNNLSVVQGSRTANRMINSCTNCGLCASVCPNGFDMGSICAEARQEMTRQGRMPVSAHEFALLDMEHADSHGLFRFAPGGGDRKNSTNEDYAYWGYDLWFFPGCQLGASDPELLKRVYAFLRDELGAGLWLECCGAPAKWAGREDLFDEKKRRLTERWIQTGKPDNRHVLLITACSACLTMLRLNLPEVQVVSVWEVLLKTGLPKTGLPGGGKSFTLYTPCTMRDERELSALSSLSAARGIKIDGQQGGECCGYGGLQACANPDLAEVTARSVVNGIESDLLVACAMCRDRFASVGKRTAHLLDLLFPEAGLTPEARPAPSLSKRRENRERLREELLAEIWDEPAKKGETESVERDFVLEFEPSVKEKLDKRRILDEDILRVVRQAEETGRKITSPEGWNVAYLKPRNVTTWVEYRLDEETCRVRNAWSHRMVVPGSELM